MARLWHSGFELNSVTAGVEWRDVVGSPTISTTTVRTGTYAGRISSLSSGTQKLFSAWPGSGGDDDGPFYTRFYLRVATRPSATNMIFSLENQISGDAILNIRLTSAGALELYNVATQVGSDSSVLALDTWYRIEVLLDASGGAGADTYTARIDGVNFASSTTQTAPGGVAYWRFGGNILFEAQSTGDWFFDDIAINNNSGSNQNSWPGEGKIVHILPNAAGDSNQWLHDDGTAADTNNYTECDEVTPDDATTYVKRTTTGTLTDDYNCQSSSDLGIASSDTITLVSVGVRAGATSATSTNRGGVLRLKSAASGTVTSSGTLDWSVNGWLTMTDTVSSSLVYPLVSYTDPTTAVAWTPTGTNSIDNMQIGFNNAQSSTNEIRVTKVWAAVEYVVVANTDVVKDVMTSSGGIIPFPR